VRRWRAEATGSKRRSRSARADGRHETLNDFNLRSCTWLSSRTKNRRPTRHAPFARFLTAPSTAVEPTTGEAHLRHHISPTGYYRGKKVAKGKGD
jgi:ribosomal protein L32